MANTRRSLRYLSPSCWAGILANYVRDRCLGGLLAVCFCWKDERFHDNKYHAWYSVIAVPQYILQYILHTLGL